MKLLTAVLLSATGLIVPTTAYADPPGTIGYGEVVSGVALSQGQLYYVSWSGSNTDTTRRLYLRSLSRTPGVVQLGAEQSLGTVANNAIAASSGRLVFDRRARSYTGQIRVMGGNAVLGRVATGNRALVQDWNGPLLGQTSYANQYDAKTQKVVNVGTPAPDLPQPKPAWPQGPQDADGNFFIRARPDGSVIRRDWQIGRETVIRPAGSAIAAVAIHGPWVAWVTACPRYQWPCDQRLTVRNLSTGYTATSDAYGTSGLDMSGADLAYDHVTDGVRDLRTNRLGTSTVTTIGQLPEYLEHGMGADMFGSEPRHFDVEDETIAWIGRDLHGYVAPLAPSIDPPHYLGNSIAPASFSTSWAIAVPVSKPLPVCTVTILRGSTTVRVLGCANTIGMVGVVWNGRTASGATLPAGKYTYRVSGRDDDGYWLRHYDGVLRSIVGTVTKTS